jgi:hypothetical protein
MERKMNWKPTKLVCIFLITLFITEASKSSRRSDPWLTQLRPYLNTKGLWPFKATDTCDYVDTRDRSYKHSDEVIEIPTIADCGLNRFSTEEDAGMKRTVRNLRSWLEEFKSIEENEDSYISKKQSRKKYDANINMGSRIVGGESVSKGSWPWLGAVGLSARGPRCGATLINDRWLITAAHCFKDSEKPCLYNVRLGATNWLIDSDDNHVDRQIKAIYRHPDYDDESSLNDIALLKLSEPVSLDRSSYINAICLPNGGRSVKPGTLCMAAGWGLLSEKHEKAMQSEARQVGLPVLAFDDGKCGKYDDKMIRKGMLCAGYLNGGRDTCQGDSGGPLVYKLDGRWYHLGVTSFGVGCARAGKPGVYTDVGQFLHWIGATIKRHS